MWLARIESASSLSPTRALPAIAPFAVASEVASPSGFATTPSRQATPLRSRQATLQPIA